MTLYIAERVDVVCGRGDRPGPLRDQFADLGPPFAQCRVWPALPRHLPPCLGVGQRPGDGDGVGLILEPDRGTDEDVAQRHAAGEGTGRVLGEVGVDELPGASGPGQHPVDDEYPTVSHSPTIDTRRDPRRAHSRPSGELVDPDLHADDGGQMSDPFSPVQLGPVTLGNRIIKAATSEGRSPEGLVTDDLIAFHRSFADGGVGMTTVAYCCVSPEGASAPGQIVMSPQALPGLRRLTDTVHGAGAAISAQLGHAGVVAPKSLTGVTAVAPSRFVNPTSFAYCRAITRDEIRVVVDQFSAAAQVAIDAGFDAVELHFGHLYLPSSFMSPLMNRRKDEYGGSIDNRSRFAREIAERVREVAGGRVAVIAKLDMDDGLPGSIWIDEALRTAQLLDADGALDAIELTQGSSVYKPMYLFRGDVPVREFARVVPPALRPGIRLAGKRVMGNYPYTDLYMLEAARQFVPVVQKTKLILLGGITNRDHLETGMSEGFDFMAMGRALLREPDLVNKMTADPATRSRCTHNNKCMVTVFGRTHCVLDPEQRYGPVPAKVEDTAATPVASLQINS